MCLFFMSGHGGGEVRKHGGRGGVRTYGVSEGACPLARGYPTGAGAPCWRTALLAKSSVLVRPFAAAGAGKGLCGAALALSCAGRTEDIRGRGSRRISSVRIEAARRSGVAGAQKGYTPAAATRLNTTTAAPGAHRPPPDAPLPSLGSPTGGSAGPSASACAPCPRRRNRSGTQDTLAP